MAKAEMPKVTLEPSITFTITYREAKAICQVGDYDTRILAEDITKRIGNGIGPMFAGFVNSARSALKPVVEQIEAAAIVATGSYELTRVVRNWKPEPKDQ